MERINLLKKELELNLLALNAEPTYMLVMQRLELKELLIIALEEYYGNMVERLAA